jgi:hypothetical protein
LGLIIDNKMAIDTTLIKGAAQANKAREPVAAMAIAGTAEAVGETLTKAVQAKAKEEENKRESAEQEWVDIRAKAAAEVGLGPEFYGMLRKETEANKGVWADGDAETKERIESGVLQRAGEIDGAMGLKAQVLTADLGGLSPAYSETPEGKAFTAALMGSPVIKDNLMGYNIPVEGSDPRFVTITQASEEYNTNLLDTKFQGEMLAIAEKAAEKGGNVKTGETGRYNRTEADNAIRSLVINTKNKASLIHDNHLDGSFMENVIQALGKISYGDLGITVDGVNAADGIQEDEPQKIAEALLEKEHSGLLDDMLVDYYVGVAQKNYNAALGDRVASTPTEGPSDEFNVPK